MSGYDDTDESVKLLTAWASTFGMRVVIALKEKGVEYEYIEEDLSSKSKSQLLLHSNPVHKKIPVLIHNGKPVCESLIIVQYIDEAWASKGPSFLPKDPYHRALARFWADYVDKKFSDPCTRILRSPEGELQEQAKKDAHEALTILEGALRDVFGGGNPYFGGDVLGLVDIALAPFIAWFKAYETIGNFKLLDEKQCPRLSAWVSKVREHPSVKAVLTTQAPPDKVVELATTFRKRLVGA